MRLTGRGWVVVAGVFVAVGSAGLFGARGLNAIAAPGVVVLVAAVIQVHRIERPSVGRELPEVANRGDVVPVRLRLDAAAAFPARVLDHLDFGVVGDGNDVDITASSGSLRYSLGCTERGEKRVGPTRVEARDVLGLVAHGFRFENAETLAVRPRIYPLTGGRRRELLAARGGERRDRQVFEHLREYDRGDALRDVHWKTSAKQPDDDLIVKEFTSDDEHRGIVVAAAATPGAGDAMADAAASVVVDLLESGFEVELVTPETAIGPAQGPAHRGNLLDHLASVDDGEPSPEDRDRADVRVSASRAGVTVSAGDRDIPFEKLALLPDEDGLRSFEGARAGTVAT